MEFRISEAASIAGCCGETLRRAVRTGDLPATRLFGRLLVEKADLDKYLTARKRREGGRASRGANR